MMSKGAPRSLITASLAFLCVVLIGAATVLWWLPIEVSLVELPRSDALAESSSLPEAALPSLDNFKAIGERPIFNPSRKPVKVVSEQGAKAKEQGVVPTPFPQLILVGIVAGPDGASALLKTPSVPKTFALKAGDAIEGWAVEEIVGNSVVFKNGATKNTLNFAPSTRGGRADIIVSPGVH